MPVVERQQQLQKGIARRKVISSAIPYLRIMKQASET